KEGVPRYATITINGKTLAITTNLKEALWQARLTDRPRALWTDSVCINQRDEAEKAQQVGLMGRIYKMSSCTLICLG
ncbi:HET-domain-containing protein, partial [Cryphonectria parasitica EP155]